MSVEKMLSMYIPRVFANIHWRKVKETIEESGLGVVDRVDMIKKKNEKGEEYKTVYIHMKEWKNKEAVEKLEKGEEIKLVYDEPWYWKIYKNKLAKPSFEKKKVFVEKKKGFAEKKKAYTEKKYGESYEEMLSMMSAMQSKMNEMEALIEAQQKELMELREKNREVESPVYYPEQNIFEEMTKKRNPEESWADMDDESFPSPPKLIRQKAICESLSGDSSNGMNTPVQSVSSVEKKSLSLSLTNAPKKKSKKKMVTKLVLE